jgi:hypothetical protein
LELKIGANGLDGVNGQYLAAMVSQHTGQKKAFKNNDSLLIKMALKEKWRYPEWQKRKGARWGHPLLLMMRG